MESRRERTSLLRRTKTRSVEPREALPALSSGHRASDPHGEAERHGGRETDSPFRHTVTPSPRDAGLFAGMWARVCAGSLCRGSPRCQRAQCTLLSQTDANAAALYPRFTSRAAQAGSKHLVKILIWAVMRQQGPLAWNNPPLRHAVINLHFSGSTQHRQ